MHQQTLSIVENQTTLIDKAIEHQRLSNKEAWVAMNKVLETQRTTIELLKQTLLLFSSRGQPIYTATNIPLSVTHNYLLPISKFKESCHVCRYYGHGAKDCPNIEESGRGACINCWSHHHKTNSCRNWSVSTPFKSRFLSPDQLVLSFGTVVSDHRRG